MQKKMSLSERNHPQLQKAIIQPRIKFYEILNNIANRLKLKDTDGSFTKRYLTKIPYILENQYNCKAVFIKSYRDPREVIKFPKIDEVDSKNIIIHVTEGELELVRDDLFEVIFAPSTHFIDTQSTNVFARVRHTPTNFTIIIQHNPLNKVTLRSTVRKVTPLNIIKHIDNNRIVINNVKITPLPASIKRTPKPRHKNPISYIRAEITQNDMIDRILFLDAEFVKTESKHSVGSITIINYDGKVIFDKIIKPKESVINYMSRITGFNKRMLDKGMPEDEALEIIHKIVEGKILVGSDLSQDIKILEINTATLLGIRDLSTAKVLRRKMKIEDHRIGLAAMVNHFFKIKLHQKTHSSLEDTKFIREIYLQIAKEYEDDYYTSKPGVDIDDIDSETDSYGTPLYDEIDLEYYEDATDKMDYQLEPVSDDDNITLDEQIKIPENSYNINNEDTDFITIKIPKSITTKDGKILKPEYIQYSDTFLHRNEQYPVKVIQKYFPTELQLL